MHDCLIVGGGVIGLSLAYELVRHGLRVRLIDRKEPGREASWAGAGILPPARRDTAIHPLEQLRGLSHRLHAEWAAQLRDETGIDTGYRQCGGLYLARSIGESAALEAFAAELHAVGIAARRLKMEELVELEPALGDAANSRQLRAAYFLPEEAQLRNPHHLQALVAACRRRGVQIDGHVEALDFELRDGRLAGVRTTDGMLVATNYCFASGAWTHALLTKLGVPSGILPIRGQMVLFRCAERPFRHVINEGSRYLVPRDDGHVLAGSTEEEAGFDKSTTRAGIDALTEFARSLVAPLREATIEATWAGLRPGTFDGLPYVGRVPGLDNTFVAAGHFRSGLHMSTGTAVVLSQLLRGEQPEIDLSPFYVGRG